MANNRVKSTNDLELKDRLVAINRVTKVTKGGRTFSFAAIVVVGNEDGIIGWGLGKAGEESNNTIMEYRCICFILFLTLLMYQHSRI